MSDRRDCPHANFNACVALVTLAEREAIPGMTPRRFVRRLGHAGAGVRPGFITGLLDLALAGNDRLRGHGFLPELDDGTGAQVRHFCGVAAACDRFGARATKWISVNLRNDPPHTPDGRLTDRAIEFVGLLYRDELGVADAAGWLQQTLCEPASDFGPDRVDPPPHTPYA